MGVFRQKASIKLATTICHFSVTLILQTFIIMAHLPFFSGLKKKDCLLGIFLFWQGVICRGRWGRAYSPILCLNSMKCVGVAWKSMGTFMALPAHRSWRNQKAASCCPTSPWCNKTNLRTQKHVSNHNFTRSSQVSPQTHTWGNSTR